jgi:acyl phosphate:glycerol-3-phosphate acyltransferase
VLSPYLRGRGGKGVATSLGAILAVFPLFALGLVALFGLVLWRTRWVAGASLAAAVALAVWAAFGPLPEPVLLGRLWGLAVALVIIARHHGNIRWWLRQRRG